MSNAPVDDLSRPKPHLPEPNTERALRCRSKMSPGRWEEEVEKALWRVQVVRHVKRAARKGHGHQGAALREIAPGVHWSTVCYWRRCLGTRPGPEWERLLDGRVPPAKPAVPPEVRVAATLLRRVEPSMRPGKARELLGREYGAAGRVSPATLYLRLSSTYHPKMSGHVRGSSAA